ncbi:MAG: alpha/beta hydrolase [Pseudomonadota bacterium]
MTQITRCTFTGSSGNRLAADAGGALAAPPVLLLHGGGQTRHSWGNAQRELIADGYRVLSVDARGHGESDWVAGGDYSLDSQVGDVRAIARSLGRRPALVGASMGGVNALIACGDDSSLASALVLVDVTPRMEAEGIDQIERFMGANPDGFDSIDSAGDAVAAYYPTRPRPANLEGLRKNLRQRDNGRWYWHWDPAMFGGDREAKVSAMRSAMLAAATKIRIPTLLVRGAKSEMVTLAGVAELRAQLPHLEFVDIAGAGHMIAGDRNDAFNGAVSDFLRRHVPSGESA